MIPLNFDYSDKNSIRWFILLPSGHEGPYSLDQLIQLSFKNKSLLSVKVWAEGLKEPEVLVEVMNKVKAPKALSSAQPEVVKLEQNKFQELEPPPLPPLPEEELDIPPIPDLAKKKIYRFTLPKKSQVFFLLIGCAVVSCVYLFLKSKEEFYFSRPDKMDLDLFERILTGNTFDGWNKDIFFKEYISQDYGHVWLVTSSFHQCEVEAKFTSVEGKLLTLSDEEIVFKSTGTLKNHLVEFSSFEFSKGQRILPGLYEMNVRAQKCEWSGLIPSLLAKDPPDKNYVAQIKVVLFPKGAKEFSLALDEILKKRQQVEMKKKNEEILFWESLSQKLLTLEAITLQIEQHFLDFLSSPPKDFKKNVKTMVDKYSKQYGTFFTSFVLDNEKELKKMINLDVNGTQNYHDMIKSTSTQIGMESMKFIEEFMAIKKTPTNKELQNLSQRVKKTFSQVKDSISQKITEVSSDQENQL